MLQYNSKSGNYEAIVDGQLIEVDSDVVAEELQERERTIRKIYADYSPAAQRNLIDEAEKEVLSASLWTGSTPMHGVSIDGVEQK